LVVEDTTHLHFGKGEVADFRVHSAAAVSAEGVAAG
jgi:hypothetical protein